MAPAMAATSPSLSFTLANSFKLGAGMLRSRLLYLQQGGSRPCARWKRCRAANSDGRAACEARQQVKCQIK